MNNLRQLGIAVHDYHDVHKVLPPLATDSGGFSWAAMLLPFHEGPNVYNRLSLHHPPSDERNLPSVTAFRDASFFCPSRRGGHSLRASGAYRGGQPTDYAAVSTTDSRRFSPHSDGMIVFRKQPPSEGQGPVSATNFDDVADGLSNTFMFGEKHMAAEWFEGPWDEPALVAMENQTTIRLATDRLGGHSLANSPEDPDDWKFGSWHHGVTLFAHGDAHVEAVKNDASPRVLRLLSGRNNGVRE